MQGNGGFGPPGQASWVRTDVLHRRAGGQHSPSHWARCCARRGGQAEGGGEGAGEPHVTGSRIVPKVLPHLPSLACAP